MAKLQILRINLHATALAADQIQGGIRPVTLGTGDPWLLTQFRGARGFLVAHSFEGPLRSQPRPRAHVGGPARVEDEGVFALPGVGDIHMEGVIDSETTMKTTVPLKKKTTAISVVLEAEIIAHLDHTSVGMRLTTGQAINRSTLIRAILTANLAYSIEWTHCLNETEIVDVIGRRLVTNQMLAKRDIKQPKPV